MTAELSRELAGALDDLMTPAQRERVARYRQELAAIEEKHGAPFAALWVTARKFIEMNGRVRLPPTHWDFVPIAAARAAGNAGEFAPEQAVQFKGFWDWYLPVERGLTDLIHCIRELHKLRKEHDALFQAVCLAAHPIYDQYQRWIREGRIGWLPRNRGGDAAMNIVQRLGKVLIKLDTGPLRDDGDPGPELEPMP
jgi:predicted transcriptional regulator